MLPQVRQLTDGGGVAAVGALGFDSLVNESGVIYELLVKMLFPRLLCFGYPLDLLSMAESGDNSWPWMSDLNDIPGLRLNDDVQFEVVIFLEVVSWPLARPTPTRRV